MPFISVIIPIYNVEKYLKQCIDSVLNQDFKDVEVILVDDGSHDNCPVICDEYASKDDRIKVMHKLNGGSSSARNRGIEESTGDYLMFIDSDDWWNEDASLKEIYCETSLPKNDICKLYFQITDGMVVKNFFNRKKVGRILDYKNIKDVTSKSSVEVNKVLEFIKRSRFNIFILAKSIVWRYSNWKTNELEKFILDFAPDVIFAPCYPFPFQLALTRYVSDLMRKKIVTYSGDDNYSLRQFSLSPFFGINRFWNRHYLRKTYPYYDVFYSMSEDEIPEMSPVVGKQMKILCKGVSLKPSYEKRAVHNPIKMIYAGGIYIERWKILFEIGRVIKKINVDEIKIRLDIYTANALTKKQKNVK